MLPDLTSRPQHEFDSTVTNLMTKYRRSYRQLLSLQGDAELLHKNTRRKFLTLLLPTWAFIFYRQATGKPLYFLRQYGRVFKTHRVFRMYSYSFLAFYAYCWIPYNRTLVATTQKLIDTDRIRANPGFVDHDVKMPQQLDISGMVLPHKKLN